ncbi:50S ribosomal protein L32e [Candidatus Parvarchaeota archaeon]|nr:50S ribosomal protein L32e [Candidatus Parvarchaeota archaeon]
MVSKRKHPTFRRTNYGRSRRSRIKDNWRRPRGIDNKQREKYAYMGKLPSIGYGNPAALKNLHPSGMKEARVFNAGQLAGLKDVVVRIAGGVGAKKAALIFQEAKKAGLRILNYKAPVPRPKKDEKKAPEAKKEIKGEAKQPVPLAR